MKQQAKALSAGSVQVAGTSRRALATRGARHGATGSGAPLLGRFRVTLAVLALAITAFAATAASASAAPLKAEIDPPSKVSYASVHVSGKLNSPGCPGFCGFVYSFQYSKNPGTEGWNAGPGGFLPTTEFNGREVFGDIEGLKGGTKYFVRLHAFIFGGGETDSPEVSFTTLPVDSATVLAADNASDVKYTTAKASGEIKRPANPDPAFNADCRFEFVTDAKFDVNGFAEAAPPVPCGIDPLSAPNQTKHVEVPLEGLEPATEYHLRLTASNAGPDASLEAASTFTTLPVDPPSVVSLDNASDVEYTQAQVKGVVERPDNADPAFDVSCHFEYVTDQQFNENPTGEEFAGAVPVDCNPNPVTAADTAPGTTKTVSATLGGLTPSTTYHLRLAISNKGGADSEEAAATFTTLGPIPKPTVLAADDASQVSYVTAKASGEIERPAGADPALDTSCRFEYITDQQFDDNVTNNGPGAGFDGAAIEYCNEAPPWVPLTSPDAGHPAVKAVVTANLAGLSSETTYHLRLVAENQGGTDTEDAAATFTTLTVTPPALAIDPPSSLGYTKVHLSGTVDPEGGNFDPSTSEPFPISWTLQFSRADQPGNWGVAGTGTISGVEAAATGPIAVATDLGGLSADTEYKYRLTASFVDRSAASLEGSFKTQALAKPLVTFDPIVLTPDHIAKFTATVATGAPPGPLSPEGVALYETKWHFECKPACPETPGFSGTVAGDQGTQAISVEVRHLELNLAYEVEVIATNAAGTATADGDFTTPLVVPDVKSFPGASDGEGGYILQGTVNPNNSTVTDCYFEYGPTATYPNTYKADCSPQPKGRTELEYVEVHASQQFTLSLRGETTNTITDERSQATAAVIEAELKALPSVGPTGIAWVKNFNNNTSQSFYEIEFGGPLAEVNLPPIEVLHTDGTTGRTTIQREGGNSEPVTVVALLEGLTVGAVYHFKLFATNAAGQQASEPGEFKPTLAAKESCPANEQQRVENSSLALPECRAYEMVTPPGKEGADASIVESYGGVRVRYFAAAANIAHSGQNLLFANSYVSERSAAGWATIPNLNGTEGGSIGSPPSSFTKNGTAVFPGPGIYSEDLLSSVWSGNRTDGLDGYNFYLRKPDGLFTLIGPGNGIAAPGGYYGGASDDLSHLILAQQGYNSGPPWAPTGVVEFVGTESDQPPRRVDVDNSGSPIGTCGITQSEFISDDGRVVLVGAPGGCGSPPAAELWARIAGTTSIDVSSASRCNRTSADPGGVCNDPVGVGGCPDFGPRLQAGPGCRGAVFRGAADDGSRIFFTTKRQLLNADTDETRDLYACDIPAGTPDPVGEANSCSALRQASGAQSGADVENFLWRGNFGVSDDGSSVLFTARGALADNKDAFDEKAVAGDHNLYIWRTDAAHPNGRTIFVGRLDSNDATDQLGQPEGGAAQRSVPQFTPDGRFVVFATASRLIDSDTDESADVYRYDADTGELSRASTSVSGGAGNGEFDASIPPDNAVSDDGQKIVFSTTEGLKPAVDGNGEPDAYLWTPARVSLISAGSVGGGATFDTRGGQGSVTIDGSGENIYFETPALLSPADGDDLVDVYDARIGGGFSFIPKPVCAGEKCQPDATPAPPKEAPLTALPGPGNPTPPKPCPKGKVRNKKGKCVKKHKKHSGKKRHGKKAGHRQGGGK